MPELPEVETLRRGLQKTIVGKKIKAVAVRLPKIVSVGPKTVGNVRKLDKGLAKQFQNLLEGRQIVGVKRRAKMLILDLSGHYTILIHLKLTGQLIFARRGENKKVKIYNSPDSPVELLPHKYTHLIFNFTDGSRLFYNDLRQFGYVKLVKDNELNEVQELAEYGPEPDSKEFTLENLQDKAKRRPTLTIKQFLMDPKVVAGIGNIYSDEILYWAKIRPNRKVSGIRKQEFGKIYGNIKNVLKKAVAAQGSSVGDFFKLDGTEGSFGKKHMVYRRYGKKCYTCGSTIEKIKLGGRTSSFCPKCQK